jgi:DNA polymerase I
MAFKKLILVDGLAVLYRAFFAITGLATRSGTPTNAVFGFIRMLKQLRAQWDPSHWAVVFDGGVSDEKASLLKEYKAQRPPMPAALKRQVALAEAYLECARVAWFRVDKQEADDVIASLTKEAARGGEGDILIATGDKDMYQLVDERVRVVPVSGQESPLGPEEVLGKTGVRPAQIVPWLALVGDAVDNISGVPGIGPKTAARLMAQFGSIENLRSNIEAVESERVRRTLAEHWAVVERNVKMVSLSQDLKVPFTWESLSVRAPDAPRLLAFCEELEFGAMARDLRQGHLALE